MAEYLVIRLNADNPQAASWIAVDGNGTRLGPPGTGSLLQASHEVRQRAVIVLVPATDVLTTTVNIPVRGSAKIAAALPFALEDQLADDVEDLHFAAGEKREDGQIPAAIVAREKIQLWLNTLDAANITPLRLVPETYGLTRIPGTASLLIADDNIIYNDGADIDFVMQGVKPSDAMAAAGAFSDDNGDDAAGESGKPRHLLVYCSPVDEQRFEHDWLALRSELDSVDINLLPDGALPRMAVTVAAGRGVNLLQGEFGPKAEYGKAFKPWRDVALLLLGLVVVSFATKGVDYVRLSQEQATLKQQFSTLYSEIRPGDTREVADPAGTVLSLQRSLGGSAGPQVFLPVMSQLGQALSQNKSVNVEAISYRASVLDIRLSAPDVPTLDKIQQAVNENSRYQATIQSHDASGDKVNGRIQVRENRT